MGDYISVSNFGDGVRLDPSPFLFLVNGEFGGTYLYW